MADKSEAPFKAPFVSLESASREPAPWQAVGLLKKSGAKLLVTPPGAACFALSAFLTGFLSGRASAPWGMARYPGDVLFMTYTADLDRSMRAAISSMIPGQHQVLTHRMRARFDWKNPLAQLDDAFNAREKGETAAVIIDAGPVSPRINDAHAEAAINALDQLAEDSGCLVLLVVESSSTKPNPFDRIPPSLRFMRGTLLAAPLRSKALTPHPHDPARFLLIRLPQASAAALSVQFTLTATDDMVEASRIWWEDVKYGDPLEVFRHAEIRDYSHAERIAAQFATEIILARGPMSSRDLQAVGLTVRRIAKTTTRDALGTASVAGHLAEARYVFDNKTYWVIPGVTPLPAGMYIIGQLRDDQIPF